MKIDNKQEYVMTVIMAAGKGTRMKSEKSKLVQKIYDKELVKRVNILMKHELKYAHLNLNTSIKTNPDTILNGNIVSLVQVINNMISNDSPIAKALNGHKVGDIVEIHGIEQPYEMKILNIKDR